MELFLLVCHLQLVLYPVFPLPAHLLEIGSLQFSFLFLIISLIGIASAQNELSDQKKITLKDGSQLIGRVIEEDSQMIRFRTAGGIEMEINKSQIEKIEERKKIQ